MKKTKKEDETTSSSEVTIGTQVWMVQNLNVSTFCNGDVIPQAKSDGAWKKAGENKQPAWCYYKNDPANGEKYGKLYNWYAVNDPRGLAPTGYHVPSDAEWTQLSDYLGSVVGKKMKSTSGWWDPAGYRNGGNGTNKSGFNGLPGGSRWDDGQFANVGGRAHWWSTTEYVLPAELAAVLKDVKPSAWCRALDCFNGNLDRHDYNERYGFSVRCLRD